MNCYSNPYRYQFLFFCIVLCPAVILKLAVHFTPLLRKSYYMTNSRLRNLIYFILGWYAVYGFIILFPADQNDCFEEMSLEIFNHILILVIGLIPALINILNLVVFVVFCPCIIIINYRMWKGRRSHSEARHFYFCQMCHVAILENDTACST